MMLLLSVLVLIAFMGQLKRMRELAQIFGDHSRIRSIRKQPEGERNRWLTMSRHTAVELNSDR